MENVYLFYMENMEYQNHIGYMCGHKYNLKQNIPAGWKATPDLANPLEYVSKASALGIRV